MNAPAPNASVFGNDNIVVQASGSGVNVRRGACSVRVGQEAFCIF
jgi:hypothetical protein